LIHTPEKRNFGPQHKLQLRAIETAYLGSNYVRKAQPEKVHWARMPPVLLFAICFIRFWNFTQDLDDDDAKKNQFSHGHQDMTPIAM
jgi:hypothetical protein